MRGAGARGGEELRSGGNMDSGVLCWMLVGCGLLGHLVCGSSDVRCTGQSAGVRMDLLRML